MARTTYLPTPEKVAQFLQVPASRVQWITSIVDSGAAAIEPTGGRLGISTKKYGHAKHRKVAARIHVSGTLASRLPAGKTICRTAEKLSQRGKYKVKGTSGAVARSIAAKI